MQWQPPGPGWCAGMRPLRELPRQMSSRVQALMRLEWMALQQGAGWEACQDHLRHTGHDLLNLFS